LSCIINTWVEAKRIKNFFADAERRVAGLSNHEEVVILERLNWHVKWLTVLALCIGFGRGRHQLSDRISIWHYCASRASSAESLEISTVKSCGISVSKGLSTLQAVC
jgi:hypothetical protein